MTVSTLMVKSTKICHCDFLDKYFVGWQCHLVSILPCISVTAVVLMTSPRPST